MFAYATRPYPSAGASYELELYLAVDKCDGLTRGFYHYDAGGHALVPIDVRTPHLEALFSEAQLSMDAPATPQIVITIAARFGRVSWKYSSLAYALILKDVGVLTSDALSDGNRHGTRRVRDREHQHRSVRQDDRDRIPCGRSGRSIRAWSRQAIAAFRMSVATRTICGPARRAFAGCSRNTRRERLFRVPSSANSAPCGSAHRITQLPPAVSSGPSSICPPPDVDALRSRIDVVGVEIVEPERRRNRRQAW